MAAIHSITPTTQILDDAGRDWSWAFVIFREIPGVSGLLIDSDGGIWSSRRGTPSDPWLPRQTAPHQRRNGYPTLSVRQGEGTVRLRPHRLVLEVFIGPCPPGHQACHNNGINADCRLVNVRWGTPAENAADKKRHGTQHRGDETYGSVLCDADVIRICELLLAGHTVRRVASLMGVTGSCVSDVKHKKTWAHLTGDYDFSSMPKRALGEDAPKSKLTEAKVREMRRLRGQGMTYVAIGRQFGVRHDTAKKAILGVTWSHVA